MKLLILVSTFLILLVAVSLGAYMYGYEDGSASYEPPTQLNSDTLFSLVNEWRIQTDLQPFTKDERICDMAKIRLIDRKGKVTHEGFKELHSRVIPNSHAGENLITNAKSEQIALTAWLKSASHSANLKEDFKYSCIAAEGDNAVQIFANIDE